MKRLYPSLALLIVAGCTTDGTDTNVIRYECPGDRDVVVEFRDGAAALTVDGGERRLISQVRAASGAKYSDGETTFWTKGDEAIVTVGDESLKDCRANGSPDA